MKKVEIMGYEEFKNSVKKTVIKYLPENCYNYKVEENRIFKVNKVLDCMSVLPQISNENNISVSPNIYFSDYYQLLMEGMPFESVMQAIAKILCQSQLPLNTDLKNMDFTKMKDKIIIQLINAEKNAEYLKNLPHVDILDLAAIYRIVFFEDDDAVVGCVINYNLMKEIGLTESELYEIGKKQTEDILSPCTIKICDELYALSNEKHYLGASGILYKKYLKQLSELFDSDIFVLPSSIHELMIFPSYLKTVETVEIMLREANMTVVEPEEWLSDRAYIFKAKSNKVEFASEM